MMGMGTNKLVGQMEWVKYCEMERMKTHKK